VKFQKFKNPAFSNKSAISAAWVVTVTGARIPNLPPVTGSPSQSVANIDKRYLQTRALRASHNAGIILAMNPT
jgi:hypothetical protein